MQDVCSKINLQPLLAELQHPSLANPPLMCCIGLFRNLMQETGVEGAGKVVGKSLPTYGDVNGLWHSSEQ